MVVEVGGALGLSNSACEHDCSLRSSDSNLMMMLSEILQVIHSFNTARKTPTHHNMH